MARGLGIASVDLATPNGVADIGDLSARSGSQSAARLAELDTDPYEARKHTDFCEIREPPRTSGHRICHESIHSSLNAPVSILGQRPVLSPLNDALA